MSKEKAECSCGSFAGIKYNGIYYCEKCFEKELGIERVVIDYYYTQGGI